MRATNVKLSVRNSDGEFEDIELEDIPFVDPLIFGDCASSKTERMSIGKEPPEFYSGFVSDITIKVKGRWRKSHLQKLGYIFVNPRVRNKVTKRFGVKINKNK